MLHGLIARLPRSEYITYEDFLEDFGHETTFWGGVGVQGEYGHGNINAEASVGVEITIGQGDVVKDVALTSSMKAGFGGLVEGEVSARMAVEGGTSIETGGGFITLSFPVIGDN